MSSRSLEGPNSVSAIAGFALGMSTAMAVSSLRGVADAYRKPHYGWYGYVAAGVVLLLPLIPRLRHTPYVWLFVTAFVPVAVSSTLAQHYGFTTDVGHKIRSVGTLISFVAVFLSALYFLRQKKELDRQIYTQSALVAFFTTVAIGVVYGVAEDSFHAPHLPLTWLSLAGMTVFVVSLFVFEKRYA